MRRMLISIALGLAVAGAADAARAQEAPPPSRIDPSLMTESRYKVPEQLTAKPSGFWTSNKPAQGGAYWYHLMFIGLGIIAVMGTTTVIIVKRAARTKPTGGTARS